ncbi:unnamed protein product, partial [marine sediment metagenome]
VSDYEFDYDNDAFYFSYSDPGFIGRKLYQYPNWNVNEAGS